MELIPFLIFAVIAFNIFKGFSKASSSSGQGDSAKAMIKRLNAQIQQASQSQGRAPNMSRYDNKSPTQRGRERLAQKNQNSPWDHEHNLGGNNGNLSPGAKVAANYLKKTKTARIASHKNEEQHGRRGVNMDQNRHRTDGWGERGDKGFLNGTSFVVLLVIGAGLLYVLSQMLAL